MATKAKMRQAAESRQPAAEVDPAGEQEVRRRAYEIYLERGAQPGHELEDWLQAERELTAIPSNTEPQTEGD